MHHSNACGKSAGPIIACNESIMNTAQTILPYLNVAPL